MPFLIEFTSIEHWFTEKMVEELFYWSLFCCSPFWRLNVYEIIKLTVGWQLVVRQIWVSVLNTLCMDEEWSCMRMMRTMRLAACLLTFEFNDSLRRMIFCLFDFFFIEFNRMELMLMLEKIKNIWINVIIDLYIWIDERRRQSNWSVDRRWE